MNIELKRNTESHISLVARIINDKVSQYVVCHDFDPSKPDGEQWHGGTYFSPDDILKAAAEYEKAVSGAAVACRVYSREEIREAVRSAGYPTSEDNVNEVIWAAQDAIDSELEGGEWEALIENVIVDMEADSRREAI